MSLSYSLEQCWMWSVARGPEETEEKGQDIMMNACSVGVPGGFVIPGRLIITRCVPLPT